MVGNLPTLVLAQSAPPGVIDSLPNPAFGRIQHILDQPKMFFRKGIEYNLPLATGDIDFEKIITPYLA